MAKLPTTITTWRNGQRVTVAVLARTYHTCGDVTRPWIPSPDASRLQPREYRLTLAEVPDSVRRYRRPDGVCDRVEEFQIDGKWVSFAVIGRDDPDYNGPYDGCL